MRKVLIGLMLVCMGLGLLLMVMGLFIDRELVWLGGGLMVGSVLIAEALGRETDCMMRRGRRRGSRK